nr:RWD domain-containing protein 4-like [Lytechinus pictus]
MSTSKEEQEEEREVLLSIYDGDACFKAVNDTTYQYRVGEGGDFKSFMVEVSWEDDYPSVPPEINLDVFFNNHISPAVKENIISKMKEEAAQWLDSAMTFTLFEFAKENAEDLMSAQEEEVIVPKEEKEETVHVPLVAKVKEKKEQLTKAQKRRITERTNFKGERPRGWDWVDVIKHLSKSGCKPDS